MLNLSSLGTFQTGLECPTTAGGTVDAATSASANRLAACRHASLVSAAARETHEQGPTRRARLRFRGCSHEKTETEPKTRLDEISVRRRGRFCTGHRDRSV